MLCAICYDFYNLEKRENNLKYVMLCAICYDFYNLEKRENNHRGGLLFTKSNTPPWVLFRFLKL